MVAASPSVVAAQLSLGTCLIPFNNTSGPFLGLIGSELCLHPGVGRLPPATAHCPRVDTALASARPGRGRGQCPRRRDSLGLRPRASPGGVARCGSGRAPTLAQRSVGVAPRPGGGHAACGVWPLRPRGLREARAPSGSAEAEAATLRPSRRAGRRALGTGKRAASPLSVLTEAAGYCLTSPPTFQFVQ